MFLPKGNANGSYTPAPAGTHIAICVKVIDLGTQRVEWQGDVKLQHKVLLAWELVDEQLTDGRPVTHSQRYTLSSSDKSTLRKHLEGWRGKKFSDAELGPGGFDIKSVLGKPCSLIVSHNTRGDRVYANTDGIGPVPKSVKVGAPQNAPIYLSLEPSQFDPAVFAGLSEGLKQVIMASPEYSRLSGVDGAAAEAVEDEVPF